MPSRSLGGPTPVIRLEAEKYGVPHAYATALWTRGVTDPLAALRHHALGTPPQDSTGFVNTSKPNAIAIFPTATDTEIFYTPAVRLSLDKLRQGYDLAVRLASTEEEVLAAVQSVPRVSLLLLAGHGTRDELALSALNPADVAWTLAHERSYLDRSDDRLWRAIGATLPERATILLLSCSTGEGRDAGENLANTVRTLTGKRVVAADRSINLLQVERAYPLDARLAECQQVFMWGTYCQDATYEPR